ncbi:MAG: PadR family transcriptional regulator [Sporolactobacillus sp.]|uniref:PadR family transcriptional regulator n=1 Tax=Sporolactobacillus sp. STSJ-5 TaxID=2965076 RepID=UPI0021052DBE|nr:PadR family transcriptional regulator [Sporolactobacillus sp. STSJ-5]MCQ2011347.1 PadR family transcriptional regulator [Sporolactobacillus sp. STSJ-5]
MKGRDVILGLLLDMPRTGYDINEMFQTVFSHFFSGGYGMIYPTLKKLEIEGKVRKEIVTQEGKPNKHVFYITQEGEMEFQNYLRSEVQTDVFQSDFLVRLYFGRHVSEDGLKGWLKEEKQRIAVLADRLDQTNAKWKNNMSDTQKIAYAFGAEMYKAQMNVVERYLKEDNTHVK